MLRRRTPGDVSGNDYIRLKMSWDYDCWKQRAHTFGNAGCALLDSSVIQIRLSTFPTGLRKRAVGFPTCSILQPLVRNGCSFHQLVWSGFQEGVDVFSNRGDIVENRARVLFEANYAIEDGVAGVQHLRRGELLVFINRAEFIIYVPEKLLLESIIDAGANCGYCGLIGFQFGIRGLYLVSTGACSSALRRLFRTFHDHD